MAGIRGPIKDRLAPRRKGWAVFCGLVLLAVTVRSVRLDRPLVGNFATKNVVHAMIARNWAEGRAGLGYPTLDCMVGGRRSLHMLELPVSTYLSGWLWHTLGGSLDVWGRVTAVGFGGAATGLLFLWVRRRHGPEVALGAGVALALAPISVILGQSFMLETSVVFLTIATFYTLDRWQIDGRWPWLASMSIGFALLLLTKIYMVVLLLPLVANLFLFPPPRKDVRKDETPAPRAAPHRGKWALGSLIVALLPAVAWYYHAMVSVPTGPLASQVYYSVRQSVTVHATSHALLTSPDFWCRMLDDLSGVVLTPVGFSIALVGFMDRRWREHAAWLLACLILVLALPRKFYEMNYYWMVVLPPFCVMVGLGWQMARRRLEPGRVATACLLILTLGFSLRHAMKPAFLIPEEDRAVVAAGLAVQELTHPDEPVATMHGSTIDLLYYCNRPGWAISPESDAPAHALDNCHRQGARYLVVAGPAATDPPDMLKSLTTVFRGDGFVVFRLKEFKGLEP